MIHRGKVRCLIVVLCLLVLAGPAKVFSDANEAVSAWQQRYAEAIDVGVGASGVVHIVTRNNQIFRWQAETQQWQKLPGSFVRVDTDRDGTPYAVTTGGQLRRFVGEYWKRLDDGLRQVNDVGIGGNKVFVTFADHSLGEFGVWPDGEAIRPLAGSGQWIDVDYRGNPWVVLPEGSVRFYQDGRWHRSGLTGNDIGLGPQSLQLAKSEFGGAKKGTRSVSVGPGNLAWLVTDDYAVYTQQLTAGELPSPQTETPESLLPRTIDWLTLPGLARSIAIAADGTAVTVDHDDVAAVWDAGKRTTNKWRQLPGRWRAISVSGDGEIWGADSGNMLRRLNGSRWVSVNQEAVDVAAGSRGYLLTIKPDGGAMLRAGPKAKWQALPQVKAVDVAFDGDNNPYVLDADGVIRRYQAGAWEVIAAPRARAFSLGPDGGIAVLDEQGALRIAESADSEWGQIAGVYAAVTLGPGDQPWVISTSSYVLASKMFDRH